jgi:cytochrome P450
MRLQDTKSESVGDFSIQSKATKMIPQGPPSRLPVVSRLRSLLDSRAMIRNPIQVFRKYTARLGDSFIFHFGGIQPAIVSCDPTVLQHVLKTNYENYQKSEIQMKRMRHFLGPGLLTFHGQKWHTQRRLIQQGFSPPKLESMASMMQDCLNESLMGFDQQIETGAVDIYPEMMRMTFRMVSRSLFSANIKNEDVDYISQTISTVQEFMVRQIVQPYLDPWFSLSGELKKHEQMRDRGDGIVLHYIKERRKNPGHYDDLLQILMDAVYADTGKGMSDESILHEIMQLLVAGHETSSNALCWTLYLLSRHPEYLERIRSEYSRVTGDSTLLFSDIPKMEFTTQIIEEALRLYPPFWMVDRVAVEDDRIMNLCIPKGMMVVVFIYGAHHSQSLWENPESFLPERFSKENKKNHTPYAYLPFGGGPRGCIGGNYAMLQMLMILGVVLRRYDFELAADQEISARPMIILRPTNGIKMNFRRRKRTS